MKVRSDVALGKGSVVNKQLLVVLVAIPIKWNILYI